MNFRAFRQETLSTPLTPTRERGPSGFSAHARAKPVLLFASSLGSLKGAFHNLRFGRETELRAAKLGWRAALSMHLGPPIPPGGRICALPQSRF